MPAILIVVGVALVAALGVGACTSKNSDSAPNEPEKTEIWKGVDTNYQAKDEQAKQK